MTADPQPSGLSTAVVDRPTTWLDEAGALAQGLRQELRPMTLILILVQAGLFLTWLQAEQLSPARAVAAVVALACWYAHAVAVNDLQDADADRINLRQTGHAAERPLVNGSVSASQLRRLTVLLAVVATVATLAVSGWLAPWLVVMFGLNWAYSLPPLRLTDRGGWAQVVLPLGYVVIPAGFAWALSGYAPVSAAAGLGLAGLYLAFSGRLLTKDLRDVLGDRAVGKQTFVLRHGVRRTVRLGAAVTTVGLLLVLSSGLWGQTGSAVTLTLVGVTVLAVLGIWLSAARIAATGDLSDQVVWAAIWGRLTTAVIFVLLIRALMPAELPVAHQLGLLLATTAMFAAGCWLLASQARTGRWGRENRTQES